MNCETCNAPTYNDICPNCSDITDVMHQYEILKQTESLRTNGLSDNATKFKEAVSCYLDIIEISKDRIAKSVKHYLEISKLFKIENRSFGNVILNAEEFEYRKTNSTDKNNWTQMTTTTTTDVINDIMYRHYFFRKKQASYRKFENEKELWPYRDMWVTQKSSPYEYCYPLTSINSTTVTIGPSSSRWGFNELFENWVFCCLDYSTMPCGVKI